MSQSFIHLRVHSEYSLADGMTRIDEIVSRAVADGQGAVAVTDLDNMFGAVRFYNRAKGAGLKPIIGADMHVEPVILSPDDVVAPEVAKNNRLLLLCRDERGYKSLMNLMSRAYLENAADGTPRILPEWLTPETTKGLFCLSGDERSQIGALAVEGRLDDAASVAKTLASSFESGAFLLEVQRRGVPSEAAFVGGVAALSSSTGIPLVATHPVQFGSREDYLAHEARVCIKDKQILHDRQRSRDFTPEQYFKTSEEMADLFSDIPVALSNAVAVAQSCNLQVPLGKVYLPDFPTPDGSPLDEHFASESRAGLEERLEFLFPDPIERESRRAEYEQRLETEIGVIQKMGFPGYFMIVYDFIRWGKENDVPIGPGRGSGAGSLVAYALKITDIDPLKHSLLFERFLNPERVSMPDFDVDFCTNKRGLVIDYVKRKYGESAVSQISTFGTLKGKSAVRDAGRVLDMNLAFIDSVAKLMPTKPGEDPSIDELIEREPKLQKKIASDPATAKLFSLAKSLENLPRNVGKHAGGVLIAPGKISDYSPVYVSESGSEMVSQYDKDDVEKAGLVKFDFLGVSTLTVLDKAVKMIKSKPEGENFDLARIPMDDPEAYAVYNEGNTFGVFQVAEDGIRKVGMRMTVNDVEELTALLALYRPGPLGSGMVDNYIARKHGEQDVDYPHPLIEEILRPTLGIIVYQEQVMQIAQKLAGYSLGGADILRRAMGKKLAEEMQKQKSIFVAGAEKNGVPAAKAEEIFYLIEKFADYGFNKSHSAAYAYISYQTAYLKAKQPVPFFAASMNVEKGNTDKLSAFVLDAKKNGVAVLPPDVNASQAEFSDENGSIRYGLSALKGMGETVAAKIAVQRREGGPFKGFVDFCERMALHGGREFNKKAVEILIKSGAFDSLEPNRAQLIAGFESVWSAVDKLKKRGASEAAVESGVAVGGPLAGLACAPAPAQGDLLGEAPPPAPAKKSRKKAEVPYVSPDLPSEWPALSNIEVLAMERQAIGFNLGEHPYTVYAGLLGGLPAACKYADVNDLGYGEENQLLAGMVVGVKVFNTAKGKMGKVTITDGESRLDVAVFAEQWEQVRSWLKEDVFVAFEARISDDRRGAEYGKSISANFVRNFSETRKMLADSVAVALLPSDVEKLASICEKHKGDVPMTLYHPTQNGYVRCSVPSSRLGIEPSDEALDELSREFGEKHVKLQTTSDYVPTPRPGRERKAKGDFGGKRRF